MTRVLVVDDDPVYRALLDGQLSQAGYTVLSAADAVSASRLALCEQPDLVLLDIGLPDGTGLEVAAALSTMVACWAIPFIVLTGKRGPSYQESARRLGACAFLEKPVRPDVLLKEVARALSAQAMASPMSLPANTSTAANSS